MTVAERIEIPEQSKDGIDKGRRPIRLDESGLSASERVAARFRYMIRRIPLHRLCLRGKFPLKLLAVPDDPIRGDRPRGAALLEGTAMFHGHSVPLDGLDFADLNVPNGLEDYLQSFEWLHDLVAAGPREEIALIAEKPMRNWRKANAAKVMRTSCRPDMWEQRVLLWASHAPLILSSGDPVYRSAVLARGAG